jgi:hypothetical protein
MPNADTFIKTVYRRYNPSNTSDNKWEVILFKTSADQVLETETKKVLTATERTKLAGIAEGATNVTSSTVEGWGYAKTTALSSHTGNTSNPHSVTKAQVGLGDVVNAGQTSTYYTETNEPDGETYFNYAGAKALYLNLFQEITNMVAVANGANQTFVATIADLGYNDSLNINNAEFIQLTKAQWEALVFTSGPNRNANGHVLATKLKIGDVVLITDIEQTDLWVSDIILNSSDVITTIELRPLEARKMNLGSYSLKSETVSTITWDGTNKKLTKTINGTTTDVVTAATIKTALSLGAAADKGVVTTMTNNTTSVDLITAAAVYNYVSRAVAETHKVTLGSTQPSSPNSGDVWLDTNNAVVVSNS